MLYRVLPKLGPLRPLAFKAPTDEGAALFAESFREATTRFRADVRDLGDRQFNFRNTSFDTGRPSRHGEYMLADDTYAELLDKLSRRGFEATPIALKRNIIAFYGDNPQPAPASRKDQKRWARVGGALRELGQSLASE